MNNRETAVRLVESLRWPVAMIVIIWLLREPLSGLIRAMTAAMAG